MEQTVEFTAQLGRGSSLVKGSPEPNRLRKRKAAMAFHARGRADRDRAPRLTGCAADVAELDNSVGQYRAGRAPILHASRPEGDIGPAGEHAA
jgi:hypothetical protein